MNKACLCRARWLEIQFEKRDEMKEVLYNYDIYPKAFLGDCKKTVTIEPLGLHSRFMADHEYTLKITKIDESNPRKYPERSGRTTLTAVPSEDGCLHFEAYFEGEGEHFIDVYANPEDKSSVCRLSVFSLAEDMAGMIPLRGDLHMHTCRSDGRQGPATVAAYYRGYGYDYLEHNAQG